MGVIVVKSKDTDKINEKDVLWVLCLWKQARVNCGRNSQHSITADQLVYSEFVSVLLINQSPLVCLHYYGYWSFGCFNQPVFPSCFGAFSTLSSATKSIIVETGLP